MYNPETYKGPPLTGEVLHQHQILGKVEVTDPERRREVVRAVRGDIRAGFTVTQAKCFNPRHVLRVVKGGRKIDVVICFECNNYELYDGEQLVTTGGTPAIAGSAEPLLNKILTDAGVPLAPSAKH
jgi:hypothetical protein